MRALLWTIATLFIGGLGAEAASRLLAGPPEAAPDPAVVRAAQAMTGDGRVALHCFASDPDAYFEVDLRDDRQRARYERAELKNFRLLEAVPHCNEARYDARGVRERESEAERTGARRAIVLGSGVVEGFGLREADTLSRRVEAELGRGWEVLSCARSESRGDRVAESAESCLGLEPDVVVLAFSPIDVDRSKRLSERGNDLFGELVMARSDGAAAWWRSSLLASALEAGRRERRLGGALATWYRELFGENNKRGWLRTKRRIREVRALVESGGARFVLVSWPLLPEHGRPQPFDVAHRAIDDFARSRDIAHLDLWPVLRQLGPGDRWIHPLDARPSAAVMRAAARPIAAVVGR